MKKLISILCTATLISSFAVFAEEEKTQIGPVNRVDETSNVYELTTPEKNIFKIEGNDREFILLDDEQGFFVLCKDVYGTRAFDPDGTQKFDPEDSNNIAYWLNNGFLKDGNGGFKLPEEIIKYIDNDRSWFTEGGFSKGNCPDDYTVRCGITLLSQQEWLKYDEVFGVLDDIPPYGWWLRTGRGIGGDVNMVLTSKTGDGRIGGTFGDVSSGGVRNYIRPAFYLKDEFFKEVKLDKIGFNVGKALSRHFSYTDFRGDGTVGYSNSEMRNFGFNIPFQVFDEDDVITENILNDELKFRLSGSSTEKSIMAGQKQSIKTVLPISDSVCYEIILSIGTENLSKANGAVLYADYYGEDGKTKTGIRKELLSVGGTKKSEDYIINNPDVPKNTQFILFTVEIKEGISGTVSFGGIKLREFYPNVKFETDWGPLNIIDPEEDSFNVEISCETSLPKVFTAGYKITYSDGKVFYGDEQKIQLPTDGVSKAAVSMKNVRRGNGVAELYVKYGYCTVKTMKKSISVLETYNWEKDNGLIRHGIVAHPDRYWAGNKTIADAIYYAGFNLNRSDLAWYYIENKKKGEYNFDQMDTAVKEMKARNVKFVPILTYSSTLYSEGTRSGINTNEEMEGFVNFARAVVTHYPDIDTYELWNEPNNNGFWNPKSNANEYANFVKVVSKAIKEVRPDVKVIAGAIDVSKNGVGWARELFDYGIYPYVDAFSTHPYYHPSVNDEVFLPKLKQYSDIIEDYGGWKDLWLTEIGWTTFGKTELEETQAKETVKILAHSDYSGVTSTIFNITAGDEDFGMIDLDVGYRVKPNYLSAATYYVQTQNAQFITKPDLDPDCHSFLYRKNNRPLLISWCHTGGAAKLTFEKPVKVYDMYGNFEYEAYEVEQTDSPQYIYVSDDSFFYRELKNKTVSEFEAFCERYRDVIGDGITAEIAKNNEYIKQSYGFSKDDVNKIYSIGTQIIDFLGNDILKPENTNMLCEYNKCAMETADMYSLQGEGFENISDSSVTEADEGYRKLLGDNGGTKRFTYELLRHSKKHSELAKQMAISKNVEKGAAAGQDQIAANLVKWAKAVMDIEGIENIGISFQAVPGTVETFEGTEAKEKIYIYNSGEKPQKGKLKIFNSSGDTLYESNEITVPARGKYLAETAFVLGGMGFGEQELLISFEGDIRSQSKVKASIIPRVDIAIDNSEKTVDNIDSVTLELTNKMQELVSGKVKITPPDGWIVENDVSFEIIPEGVTSVKVPVTAKERVAFNCYMFDVEVFDSTGNLLIKKTVPLDFSVIVKAEEELSAEEFDGNIRSWSNAYPTYVNFPQNPGSGEDWRKSDIAARVFTKWDQGYLYVLADIYDDIQNQLQHGAAIYNGDSIQIAVDTLNNKNAGAYDSDDYEYGFALTQTGEETYAWHTAYMNEEGIKPGGWSRVLRDEENKNTRYFIKIPKADLAPMDFAEGTKIGLNYVINDANLVGTRESWYELTWGIGTRKDPSSYLNWELVPFEEITENGAETVSEIFNTEMADVGAFSDISGHWAEQIIKSAYDKGIVKGMGNRIFAPDKYLTVAEAISLIERFTDLPDSEYQFDDIEKTDWYYKPIAKMFSAGYIPDELVKNNKIEPMRVINREEFAALIAKYIGASDETEHRFPDEADISDWAKAYVNKVAYAGIMIGDNEGNFNPKGGLTRAEAATVILKISER